MKVREVTASVSQTIQIQQYEPRQYQSSITIELDKDDSVDEARALARKLANEEVAGYFQSLKDQSKTNNRKLKPEILSHPNIPKPLHGIAPRTIKGQTWWNKTRQEVYASSDYHCIACGVHKDKAQAHQWLEAHEFWDIDYTHGEAVIKSIEPLCHYCHNFIHSGRLEMIIGNEKTEQEAKRILEHGFKILKDNKLKCFSGTYNLAKKLGVRTLGVKPYNTPETNVKWSDWKLIFEDKEYYSKFNNIDEWQEFYKSK